MNYTKKDEKASINRAKAIMVYLNLSIEAHHAIVPVLREIPFLLIFPRPIDWLDSIPWKGDHLKTK